MVMVNKTVVYYTSNREKPEFEEQIRLRLWETIKDLPIELISVSQKPIDFGKNICVGDIGLSDQNVHRQLQLGAKSANTPFIISAESDCLYPKEYFEFDPPSDNKAYRCDNVFILDKAGGEYRRKAYSECGQIAGTNYLIESIDKFYEGKGQWSKEKEHGHRLRYLFGWYYALKDAPWKFFHTETPIINIKTGDGLHIGTRKNYLEDPIAELPHWGKAKDLRKELFNVL